jgi:peptidoglycan/LPS O-acetylase OafA/YrhL
MNFDYIRLFLASVVLFSHVGLLEFLPNQHRWFGGSLAVMFFFCISGYLITLSAQNSSSLQSYALKRIRRIYPPIVLVAIVIAIFYRNDPAKFLSAFNLLLFQDHNGLSNVYSHGAFWTLVVEVQFYFLAPLVVFGLRKNKELMAVILAALYLVSYKLSSLLAAVEPSIANASLRQNILIYAPYFIAGIAASQVKLRDKTIFRLAAVGLVVFIGKFYFHPGFDFALPFALMFMILAAAKILGKFGKDAVFGDLSYGIYLYHFPAIELLRSAEINDPVVIILVTVFASFASWHLIEKPVIRQQFFAWSFPGIWVRKKV